MRAVITGTDFLKDTDGLFKVVETNTNIQMDMDMRYYFNPTVFDTIISGSEINEIVLITKSTLEQGNEYIELGLDSTKWYNEISGTTFIDQLKMYCTGSSITFTQVNVENNSVTIPYVEDNDNKLIVRVSYDTTALIDDTYTRDNWEFLKLMYDTNPNSIPNTFINDVELGFDSIGTNIRNNGNHPNYCIKKRYTNKNGLYPKIYKISTQEELSNLKTNLQIEEYLQEFIYNESDTLNNKLKYYRSTDLIYGSDLTIANLWASEHTNWVEIKENCDYDDNNEIQYWERPRYLPKPTDESVRAPRLSGDETTKVILPDGSNKLLSSLEVNDSIKSVNFPGLDLNDTDFNFLTWSGSFNDVMSGYTTSTSSLRVIEEKESWLGWFVEFTTLDGITFSDVSQAEILIKSGEVDNYVVKFITYALLKVGDVVLLFDNQTNTLVEKVIQTLYFTFGKSNVYVADFEQLDVFLTLEETDTETPRYGIITHNYSYDCWSMTTVWGGGHQLACYGCLKGSWAFRWAATCCRVGGGYGWTGNMDVYYPPGDVPIFDGYCNWQKPSDIRLKENIVLVGKSESGINIYQYNYKNDIKLYEGVMAQELIGTDFEDALSIEKNGMYSVNYKKLDVKFKKLN
jgi:hypothetical protein